MRTNTGIKSGIERDILKDLKQGDILYSAVYDNGSGRTTTECFQFDSYVKAPGSSKGIWAKYVEIISMNPDGTVAEVMMKDHKNEDGTTTKEPDWRVNDVSCGLFLDPLSALQAWEKVAFSIYSSAKRAVEEAKNK